MYKTFCNKILSFAIKIFIFLFFLINNINIFSQNTSNNITHGNEKYNARQFTEAEVDYRKALNVDSTEFIANYNLGNALYRQGKYSDAMNSYAKALANIKKNSKLQANQLAAAYHNIGNSLLSQKQYEQSIEAYKNALKVNPRDDETRYNLAYAQQFLSKQQQQKDEIFEQARKLVSQAKYSDAYKLLQKHNKLQQYPDFSAKLVDVMKLLQEE
jgi:tetratricopeptide (TPR) repeat protein